MTDISKCTGENCPVKEHCYRFTSKEGQYQSYVIAPYEIKDGEFTCDIYFGKGSEAIWKQLKDIVK